jgi:alkanesulfonate monooxygenase SsuD/methylene tetrahydromethanopterin reductase-like flavin-dependent oxidoreductase (luciferase family)
MQTKFGVLVPTAAGSIFIPSYKETSFDVSARVAKDSENFGFDSAWLSDHLMPYSILECWTSISAISALTTKIRLGTLVSCNLFRYPSLVAKMSATVDHISKGRFVLGLGAGWLDAEFSGYGIPYPKHAHRIRMLKEATELIERMWVEDKVTFSGRYYQTKEAVCNPKPVQKPRIPLWIGGRGEKLLDTVSSFADGYNLNEGTIDEFKQRLPKLRDLCRQKGRDYESIEKSWLGTVLIGKTTEEANSKLKQYQPTSISSERYLRPALLGNPDDCIKKIEQYKELGVSHFIGWFPEVALDKSGLEIFANQVMSSF